MVNHSSSVFSILFEKAILKDAYSYYVADLSLNRLIPPIIEVVDGVEEDYTEKFGENLPSYDEMVLRSAGTYVDPTHRERYISSLSSRELIDKFNKGETMPEYICRIHSGKIGWHYRKYISYLSLDDRTGHIMALNVAYNATEAIEAQIERKHIEERLAYLEAEAKVQRQLEHELEEQAKLQQDLSREKERLEIIHSIIHSGMWSILFDSNKQITDISCSNSFRQLLGYKNEEDFPNALESWVNVLYPEDMARALNAVEEAINDSKSGHIYESEYRAILNTGDIHWFRGSGRTKLNPDGSGEFFGTFVDTTRDHEAREFSDIANAISYSFESLYYVDLRDDSYIVYNSQEISEIRPNKYTGKNFFVDTIENARMTVHSDDLEAFLNFISKDTLVYELMRGNSTSMVCRRVTDDTPIYYRVRASRSTLDEHHIIIAVENVDQEVSWQMARIEQQQEIKKNLEIIDVLASEYSSVYYIDVSSGLITPYTMNAETQSEIGQIFASKPTIVSAFQTYVERMVYEPDKAKMLAAASWDNVSRELAHKKAFTTIYRTVRNGKPVYCEMKLAKVDAEDEVPTAVALGFSDKDTEILERFVADKLKNDYFGLYLADLESNVIRPIKLAGRILDTVHDYTADGYRDRVEEYAKYVYVEYRDMWQRFADPAFLAAYLNLEDRREYTYRAFEGEWRRVTFSVISRNEDGLVTSVLLAFSMLDESSVENIELQERLADQQTKLEIALQQARSASSAKTNFLFNISHDIRTPMNAVTGYTAMAKKYIADPERVGDYLNKIDMAGQNLLSLVNQVLEMSRIEAGKVVLEENETDILERTYAILAVATANANVHGVKVECNISDVHNKDVITDVSRMNQIFTNILGNAVKYTPEGGTITFTVEQRGLAKDGYGLYVFTTTDTGIGISKDFLDHIFEEFSRERTSTISGIQGTGLGMAIVKRLVDLMGGTIKIESEQGKGTKVIISMPLKIIESVKSTAPVDFDVYTHFKDKRILLVEDNEMNREIASNILTELGFAVDEAGDGDIALDKVKNSEPGHYAFVLMDIQMPRMNGYEATRHIRALKDERIANIPIIALTANAFAEDRQNAIECGMNDHLAKPISVTVLVQTLAKYV